MIKKEWYIVLLYKYVYFLFSVLLTSCSNLNKPAQPFPDRMERRDNQNGKLMGDGFLVFGGPQKKNEEVSGQISSNTNSHLWNASLAVLDFIPLISIDKVGGVIVTDWYQPENAQDRTKVKVQINGPYLEVKALKVSVYKQNLNHGRWVDVSHTDTKAAHELEMLILTKARELRVIKNERD